jgi:uncharacterized membrane protein YhaH (DUF805 family)
MEEIQKTPSEAGTFWPLALRNGLIAALVLIAFGLILQMTGLVDPANQQRMGAGNLISTLASVLVMGGAAGMAVRNYRDGDLRGWISFGGCFKVSMAIFLVIAGVTAIWTFLYMGVINPDILEMIREQAYEQAAEQAGGELPEEAERMMGLFVSPWFMAISSFIATLFLGLLIAVFVGLFMKKEPQAPAI